MKGLCRKQRLRKFQATNADEVENAVRTALDTGYKLIDTAELYENEENIGKVLKEYIDAGKVKRDELFITTKVLQR